ncbi:MAG: hypothetical protein PWQ35_464, partial [Patescibacteria group bacterium]|nr:hypothetical protein [Patescibacteria group bacterium]
MKNVELLFLFALLAFNCCEKVDFEPLEAAEEIDIDGVAISNQFLLTTENGFDSRFQIFVPKNESVKLTLSDTKDEGIKQVDWKINEQRY